MTRFFILRLFKMGLFIVLLNAGLAGCVSSSVSQKPKSVKPFQARSLKELCEQRRVPWEWDSEAQAITMRSGDATARVILGSSMVLVNNRPVELSQPVEVRNSVVMVPDDFKEKVLNSFPRGSIVEDTVSSRTRTSQDRRQRIQKIRQKRDLQPKRLEVVIDAGHGGKDPGAIGSRGTQEKDVVLSISREVVRVLEDNGVKVTMTREYDDFISLQNRTEVTSRSKADLFVSIHANASSKASVHGVEVFTLKDLKNAEKRESQRQSNQQTMFDNMDMETGNRDLEHIVSDMLYTHKQAESQLLAKNVSQRLSKFARAKNRGLKSSHFFVLRNTLIPSILVEVGFLTNPKEEKLLRQEAHRAKVANGIAMGILEYVNGT